ncbi:radical SAM protein [Desulfovibrio oxyclinae]|jgi:radical SAM protein with 4Fe4S-binding SPASM domain|uniref:radical SAM protein n=1 Tax=Desulfovibrio oxyclinae TaxID=63560 RepID=UPI000374D34C|nr:radical SAM protein [Desulfovibrio oxyclinae]
MDLARVTAINDQLNDRYVAENRHEDVVTYPKLITLTTTMRCNYRCWMCYQQHFKGDMDWNIVERLRHVLPFVKTVQAFGGEPLLYGRLEELCELSRENRCELEMITNGSMLDERRRSMFVDNETSLIKVSLEAATQQTYESIRGGDLFATLGNLKALADERSRKGRNKPQLQINFVAMERNIRELPDLVRLAADHGVDRVLVLFMNAQKREELARESLFLHQNLSDECMAAALDAGKRHGVDVTVPGFFGTPPSSFNEAEVDHTCHSPWKNCLIDMEGNVRFCCGSTPPLGNILKTDFDDMWFGETVRPFRKTVNTEKQPKSCQTCRVKSRNINDPFFHIRDRELAERLMAEKGLS